MKFLHSIIGILLFCLTSLSFSQTQNKLLGTWDVYYEGLGNFTYDIKEDAHHHMAGYILHIQPEGDYRKTLKKDIKKKLVLFSIDFNGVEGSAKHRVNFRGQDYTTNCKLFMPDQDTLELTYLFWGETVKEIWTRVPKQKN